MGIDARPVHSGLKDEGVAGERGGLRRSGRGEFGAGETRSLFAGGALRTEDAGAGRVRSGRCLMLVDCVEGYPGLEDGLSGPDLADRMWAQAEGTGAEPRPKDVARVDFSARPFRLWSWRKDRVATTTARARQ